jgi:hypothetical protein
MNFEFNGLASSGAVALIPLVPTLGHFIQVRLLSYSHPETAGKDLSVWCVGHWSHCAVQVCKFKFLRVRGVLWSGSG